MSLAEKKKLKYFIKILFNWAVIFEESISKYTSPGKIKEEKDGATLEIDVFNNVIGSELFYRKKEMITKINDLLGKKIIKSIVFSVKHKKIEERLEHSKGEHKKKWGSQNTEGIKNSELKESLGSLYGAIKEKHE